VDLTEGFSGADVSSVVNTAISIVMHDYLARYPTPEEAAKHTSEAFVSTQHFEDAVKKIRVQREMNIPSYYLLFFLFHTYFCHVSCYFLTKYVMTLRFFG
jgi:SpoVK/Ycf46/Vps4 family AAA+-type ATPase